MVDCSLSGTALFDFVTRTLVFVTFAIGSITPIASTRAALGFGTSGRALATFRVTGAVGCRKNEGSIIVKLFNFSLLTVTAFCTFGATLAFVTTGAWVTGTAF